MHAFSPLNGAEFLVAGVTDGAKEANPPGRHTAPNLLNEPDRHRVAAEFSGARLDGGDNDEDGVQDPEDGEEHEADQNQAKHQ